MANSRPVSRRVTIVFGPNVPSDPSVLLKAVADELRPKDVTIIFQPDIPSDSLVADEQLETKAVDHADKLLKDQACKAEAAEVASTSPTKAPTAARESWGKAVAWAIDKGWSFTAKTLPMAKLVKDIFF